MMRRPGDNPEAPGFLGSLEARVLGVLWDADAGEALSVQAVLEELNGTDGQRWAYNSIMTVMARLAEKGYLIRERAGRAHRYRAQVSREELTEWQAGRAVEILLEQFGDAALTGFIAKLRDRPELQRMLEEILDEPEIGSPPS